MGRKLLVSLLFFLLPSGFLQAAGVQPAVKEYKKANRLFSSGKYKEALPLYRQTLAAPPEDVPAAEIHTKIGDSFFRLGYFNDALLSYRSALREQRRSERPVTQYWIGFCCFLMGRDAEAVREFMKIPELYPASGMWVSTSYYWAGRASERMGRKAQAAEYFKKAGGDGKSIQGRHALRKAEAVKK